MNFHNFDLEYFQSQFERTVEINLADSSVKCANVTDLLAGEDARPLLEMPLYYPEVNGTGVLRERIAALYPNASAANVLVTVGAAQANWRLDVDELERLATPKTKLISIVNPNNPTGSILTPEEMARIVGICRKTGAWLHADEVYRGTELSGDETPSFWGMYERVICANSMSKAYGLAGLRIGWAVALPEMIEELWRRHEYAVIAASGPSMKLAEIALQPAKRKMLLDRQRKLSRGGHAVLEQWVRAQDGRFSVSRAVATSIAFVRYNFDMPSAELADHIRRKASVLVAPGGYLGTENHLRITVGYEPEKIQTALERIGTVAAELAQMASTAHS